MHLKFFVAQISERHPHLQSSACLENVPKYLLCTCEVSDPWILGQSTPFCFFSFSKGVNPSSLMNLFTYEKGFCFVSYLSQLCGDIKRFDSFLRVRNMTNIHINGIVHTHTWMFWTLPPCRPTLRSSDSPA